MRVSDQSKVMNGTEWVQSVLPGLEERDWQGDVAILDTQVLRVVKRRKRVYNHKTDDPAGGVDQTP